MLRNTKSDDVLSNIPLFAACTVKERKAINVLECNALRAAYKERKDGKPNKRQREEQHAAWLASPEGVAAIAESRALGAAERLADRRVDAEIANREVDEARRDAEEAARVANEVRLAGADEDLDHTRYNEEGARQAAELRGERQPGDDEDQ